MAMCGFGFGILLGQFLDTRWIGIAGWCVLLVGTPFAIRYFRNLKQQVENASLGQDGEIYVAQLLEGLRSSFGPGQYSVFHDLPGHVDPKTEPVRRWNIDHVVVGPTGIYAIETKTWRKWDEPGRTQKLHYDGQRLTFNGRKEVVHGQDILRQVDRGAERVAGLLKDTTGRTFAVRGVLVFPGWWVEAKPGESIVGQARWVMNPKALVKWIERGETKLLPEDVALATDRLTMYARQRMDD